MSKFLFTYFPLHLPKDEMENKIKTEISKMDLANSLPHKHRYQTGTLYLLLKKGINAWDKYEKIIHSLSVS